MIPSVQGSREAIAAARVSLDDHGGRFWFGNPGKVEREFYELGLLTEEERYVAIDMALQELCADHRLGPQPPDDISSHRPFPGERLFAFSWHSGYMGKQMYIKFALLEGSGPCKMALYSFHEEKPKNRTD